MSSATVMIAGIASVYRSVEDWMNTREEILLEHELHVHNAHCMHVGISDIDTYMDHGDELW